MLHEEVPHLIQHQRRCHCASGNVQARGKSLSHRAYWTITPIAAISTGEAIAQRHVVMHDVSFAAKQLEAPVRATPIAGSDGETSGIQMLVPMMER
ncbi:hypothetical protein N9L68_05950 [bacterium]|nr:hypothetical protein [bacterium]